MRKCLERPAGPQSPVSPTAYRTVQAPFNCAPSPKEGATCNYLPLQWCSMKTKSKVPKGLHVRLERPLVGCLYERNALAWLAMRHDRCSSDTTVSVQPTAQHGVMSLKDGLRRHVCKHGLLPLVCCSLRNQVLCVRCKLIDLACVLLYACWCVVLAMRCSSVYMFLM